MHQLSFDNLYYQNTLFYLSHDFLIDLLVFKMLIILKYESALLPTKS